MARLYMVNKNRDGTATFAMHHGINFVFQYPALDDMTHDRNLPTMARFTKFYLSWLAFKDEFYPVVHIPV